MILKNSDDVEELYKIKAIGELMMNQDENKTVEFSPGMLNSIGRQITESVDKILEKTE